MHNKYFWLSAAIFAFLTATLVLMTPVTAEETAGEKSSKHPKLVVLIVFDQMRGDYLQRWQPLFGEGGFKRLLAEGASFTNCHYPYAYTLTAAGHASLVTGTTPDKHGIIANEWYDRYKNRDTVTSVTPHLEDKAKGAGPYRRKVETVGDVLLQVLMGRGRVASLSIKDRSAVLMAALRAGVCYWFNPASGNFVTSGYYREDPHTWVTKFNKSRQIDKWLDTKWDRFKPDLDYAKHSSADDFISEGTGYLQGQMFPHPFQLAKTKDVKANRQNYYDAVTCSPMGNTLLYMFAKEAITQEKLGQGDTTDLLCLSFSSNDLVGHAWGPDSQELLDITLRSDAIVKALLDLLDAKVGKGNYYVALSADHGVCPLPELAKQQGKDAGRVEPELLTSRVEEFLNKKYLVADQKAPWLIVPKRSTSWIYFNYETLKELKLKQSDVERGLADWLSAQPGIEKAFTRTEMMATETDDARHWAFGPMKRSFDSISSGDVMVVNKAYHIFSPPTIATNPEKYPTYRATHGSPHPYDTHVPLVVMGPRIQPGVRTDRVAPQLMASILAESLGVPAPSAAEHKLPEGLFRK